MVDVKNEKWGFLRETSELAQKDGVDEATGLHRTGLDAYLKVIFPEVTDWVHDKTFGEHNGKKHRIRPDYRSEQLKLIVEFDGLPHYTNPETIYKDAQNQRVYESCGYRVVRIPYFIQLSNSAVKELFGVDVAEPLFNEQIPSLSIYRKASPAYLCLAGLVRMTEDFKRFPNQYKVNMSALRAANLPHLTGVDFLEAQMSCGIGKGC